uniref:p0432B10.7 protein n=1 Tax=Oryza sativa subsp. japonica TaxID=39947 RepID=Q7F2I1_ORYSJ|nr:P0432B10.7 [Oryza sativa Japonica Group]
MAKVSLQDLKIQSLFGLSPSPVGLTKPRRRPTTPPSHRRAHLARLVARPGSTENSDAAIALRPILGVTVTRTQWACTCSIDQVAYARNLLAVANRETVTV